MFRILLFISIQLVSFSFVFAQTVQEKEQIRIKKKRDRLKTEMLTNREFSRLTLHLTEIAEKYNHHIWVRMHKEYALREDEKQILLDILSEAHPMANHHTLIELSNLRDVLGTMHMDGDMAVKWKTLPTSVPNEKALKKPFTYVFDQYFDNKMGISFFRSKQDFYPGLKKASTHLADLTEGEIELKDVKPSFWQDSAHFFERVIIRFIIGAVGLFVFGYFVLPYFFPYSSKHGGYRWRGSLPSSAINSGRNSNSGFSSSGFSSGGSSFDFDGGDDD